MRQRDVEGTSIGPAPERAQPSLERAQLPEPRAPAVLADRGRFEPVQLEQLQCLRVFARGHLDLVATRVQDSNERPEHEDVRRRRHVDPDAH